MRQNYLSELQATNDFLSGFPDKSAIWRDFGDLKDPPLSFTIWHRSEHQRIPRANWRGTL